MLENIGLAEEAQGQLKAAQQDLTASLDGYRSLREEPGVALLLRDLGSVSAEMGKTSQAAALLAQSEAMAAKMNKPELLSDIRAREALVLRDEGRFGEARQLLQEALKFWRAQGHPRWVARTMYQLGTTEGAAGNLDSARSLISESEALFKSVGDKSGVRDCEVWAAIRGKR